MNDQLARLGFATSQSDQCLGLGVNFDRLEGCEQQGAVFGGQFALEAKHPVVLPFEPQVLLSLLLKRALRGRIECALEATDQFFQLIASRVLRHRQQVFLGLGLSDTREGANLAVGEFAARERFAD